MDATTWALVLGMCAATVAAVLLPAFVAWLLARRHATPELRLFVLACTLLTYGTVMLVGAVLLPLEILSTFAAPQLHEDGRPRIANAIVVAAEYGTPAANLVAGLWALVWVPWRLRDKWAAVAVAIRANNSSKPTPLRGAA